VLSTATLIGLGALYYLAVPRRRTGTLAEHAADADPAMEPGRAISPLRPVPVD
jgi:hypothetical protein